MRPALQVIFAVMLFGAGAGAARADDSLDALLRRLGEAEVRGEQDGGCRYTEVTTVSELDDDGKVKGSRTRTYDVVSKPPAQPERKLRSEKSEGEELSSSLRQERKGGHPQRSMFHPAEQGAYSFRLAQSPGEGRARIFFNPKKKDAQHLEGEALVDTVAGRVLSLRGSPSDKPMVLDYLNLTIDYGPTACDFQPTRVRLEGKAGILFMRVRFRTDTRLSDQARLEAR